MFGVQMDGVRVRSSTNQAAGEFLAVWKCFLYRTPTTERAKILMNCNISRSAASILCVVLLVSILLRLNGITFGLPALYDPDEPLFIVNGLKLLKEHTLNPGWFGHPGTTTIYAMAIIELLVFAVGVIVGRFDNALDFAHAVYTDPTIIVLPGRLFILLCGVLCVLLTFLVGRRLFDEKIGLGAAALLAINPLHIGFSQLIRTDVHSTVFILLCVLASIEIAARGKLRDDVLAGIWVGLACATKWPAGLIAIAPAGAGMLRTIEHRGEARRRIAGLMVTGMTALLTLITVSPYVVLDYPTLIADLRGEAQAHHLGASGHGFFGNMGWYIGSPLHHAFGLLGLGLLAAGIFIACKRSRVSLATIIPATALILCVLCAQSLVWDRWIVPLLPFASMFIVLAIVALTSFASKYLGRKPAIAFMMALVCAQAVPMLMAARMDAAERMADTRDLASSWARGNIPKGSTVGIEYLAFDLLPQGWKILIPAGRPGCIDAAAELSGRVDNGKIDKWRDARSILDFGTINPLNYGACRADYMILAHYDRYLAEPSVYPQEVEMYRRFFRDGTLVATFKPVPGERGGPVVRILRMTAAAPLVPDVNKRFPDRT
jgi:hypothetical protein